jgi:Na+:H+ antiporter, NhaA family
MPPDTPRPARRWRATVPWLSQLALDHLLLLPLGAAIAMVWVNTSPESYYGFTYPIAFAVNDVAMTFFFGLMTKEVIEATAPGGVLHSWRRALIPVIAAIGGTMATVMVFFFAVDVLEEPGLDVAWPVSLGVDVALAYIIARLIFRRSAAVPFVLLLAIAADALGFLALALFDAGRNLHLVEGALIMAIAIAVAAAMRRARVRSFWPYLLIAGSIAWAALFRSGLYPALALIAVVPFLPHAARDRGFLVDARPTARDALSQFEIWWRYPTHLTLFLFGLINAGVPLRALEPGTWGLPIALTIGRPVGVLVGVGVALVCRLHLPHGVAWRELLVVGLTSTIGFTVGLFMSTQLLGPGQLRAEVGMGVLLSLSGAPLALVAARLLRVGRFAPGGGATERAR